MHDAFESLGPEDAERLLLTGPLSYTQMLWVMQHSWMTITDSGGIQEESAAFGLPVLITRKTTERPEIVDAGSGKLVGTSSDAIWKEVSTLRSNEEKYRAMTEVTNPYGDGSAALRIAALLSRDLAPERSAITLKAA